MGGDRGARPRHAGDLLGAARLHPTVLDRDFGVDPHPGITVEQAHERHRCDRRDQSLVDRERGDRRGQVAAVPRPVDRRVSTPT